MLDLGSACALVALEHDLRRSVCRARESRTSPWACRWDQDQDSSSLREVGAIASSLASTLDESGIAAHGREPRGWRRACTASRAHIRISIWPEAVNLSIRPGTLRQDPNDATLRREPGATQGSHEGRQSEVKRVSATTRWRSIAGLVHLTSPRTHGARFDRPEIAWRSPPRSAQVNLVSHAGTQRENSHEASEPRGRPSRRVPLSRLSVGRSPSRRTLRLSTSLRCLARPTCSPWPRRRRSPRGRSRESMGRRPHRRPRRRALSGPSV